MCVPSGHYMCGRYIKIDLHAVSVFTEHLDNAQPLQALKHVWCNVENE